MQYVYLLTNDHVPKLVKFGFSRREPRLRAAELSAPTGVPGKWKVEHLWEVEDGYGVEQKVFYHLADKRLGRQEFFEMDAAEAIAKISAVIRHVGTNPTQRAKEQAERAQAEVLQRATEKKAAQEKIGAIQREAHELITPQEKQFALRSKTVYVFLTFLFFIVGFYLSWERGGKPIFGGILFAGAGWMFFIIPIIGELLLKRDTPNKQTLEQFRQDVYRQVLAKHGLSDGDYAELLHKSKINNHKSEMHTFNRFPGFDDSFENIPNDSQSDRHAKPLATRLHDRSVDL